MFLIDFERVGNVVRLYFGNNPEDAWGDDWNDKPYEHNAGNVYDEFVDMTVDYAFPLDYFVTEPSDDWHYKGNSPFSKEDMKNRKCPCIIVTEDKNYYRYLFLSYHNLARDPINLDVRNKLGDVSLVRLFYADTKESVEEALKSVNGVIIDTKNFTDDEQEDK